MAIATNKSSKSKVKPKSAPKPATKEKIVLTTNTNLKTKTIPSQSPKTKPKTKKKATSRYPRLTKKQEVFINAIVEGLTQRHAFYRAYPNSKDWQENSVDVAASKLFKNDKIKLRHIELLKSVEKKLEKKTIATKQEVLEFLTAQMRKQVKDQVVTSEMHKDVFYNKQGKREEKQIKVPAIIEIDTRNTDAIKAAEMLAKHYSILTTIETNDDELNAVDKLLAAIKAGAEK